MSGARLRGMKWIDLPPVWLVGALVVAWSWRWPEAWGGVLWPGLALLVVAGVLMGAAILSFMRARTTVVPRRDPSALVTGGVFRLSRNPIYLADLLVLAGFSLIWGSLPGLVLLPLLGGVLQARFIKGEEARLTEAYGDEFTAYCSATRRWL